jgi:dipeptidase
VTALWEAVERRLIAASPGVAQTAQILLDAGRSDLAADHLDYFTRAELLAALDLADTMARSIEARTRALYGIRTDPQPLAPDQLW